MGEVVDGFLPFTQAEVQITASAVQPRKIRSPGLGGFAGKRFDGGRVVGQLSFVVGPLGGELGSELEQSGVLGALAQLCRDCRDQGPDRYPCPDSWRYGRLTSSMTSV